MWLRGLAEAGCGLVARSGKVCEKLCAGLLSRELNWHVKMLKKLRCVEHFWKMRSEKCAPDCSESTFGAAPDLCGRVRTADAAPTLVDLVRRSCYAGLQPAATKGIGTAARRKAWAMLRRS